MTALNITICPNGNQYVRKKLVLNRKRIPKFEVLLDNATQILGTKNCVRLLRTPNNGTRVQDLDSLMNGGVYVAVTRPSDKLIKMQYDGRAAKQPKPPDKTRNLHSIHQRKMLMKVQSRAFQEALAEASRHRNIFVYCNGEDKGMKIHLDKRVLVTKDKVLQYISDKVQLRTGAVKSIHKRDGREVRNISGIENNGTYVAVGYGQRFQKVVYEEVSISGLTPRRPAQNKIPHSSSIKISDREFKLKKTKKKTADDTFNESQEIDKETKKGNVCGGGGSEINVDDDVDDIRHSDKGANDDGDSPWLSDVTEKFDQEIEDTSNLLESGELQSEEDKLIDDKNIVNDANDYDKSANDIKDKAYDNADIEGDLNDTFQRQGTFEKPNSPRENENFHDSLDGNNNNIVNGDVGHSPVQRTKENSKKTPDGLQSTYDMTSLLNSESNGDHFDGDYDKDNINYGDEIFDDSIYDGDRKYENDEVGVKNKQKKQSKVKRGKTEKIPKNSTNKKPKKSKTKQVVPTAAVDKESPTEEKLQAKLKEMQDVEEKPNSVLKEGFVDSNTVLSDDDVDNESKNISGKAPTPASHEPTINSHEFSKKQVIQKKKNSESEDDNDDARKPDSPTFYKASGEQSERAEQVNENQETKVEKTVDMLPAEEVEEEMEEQEKVNVKDKEDD